MLRKAGRKGFTLVEMLVVIAIIALLMALIVVLIKGSIARAKNAKAKTLVEMLNQACQSYYTDFGIYPPNGATSLHGTLGAPRTLTLQYQAGGPGMTTMKPPYIEFRKDQLPLGAGNTSPPPALQIIDPWENPIQYQNPGTNNTKGVDIWSTGANPADPLTWLTNWVRDY